MSFGFLDLLLHATQAAVRVGTGKLRGLRAKIMRGSYQMHILWVKSGCSHRPYCFLRYKLWSNWLLTRQ
jgi:hypothetical protein